ncbi:MAG: hypothetical protein RL219_332 [Actinomycetota bacterium]
MLAIAITKWPGMNQAFIFSFILTVVLTVAVIPYGKRRPVGKPLSWGEAMIGSAYAFAVLFLAYGVVPHQWLTHVQNEQGWRADKLVNGPGDIFKSKARGGNFPFDINYLQVGDAIVVGIYLFFLGLNIWIWGWWQKRAKSASTEVATSTYGRPLVKKS